MSRFKKIIARILKIKTSKIDDRLSPESVKNWDSFRGLLLITEIEKVFRIKFSMEEILSIKNIGDIRNILRKHNIDPDA